MKPKFFIKFKYTQYQNDKADIVKTIKIYKMTQNKKGVVISIETNHSTVSWMPKKLLKHCQTLIKQQNKFTIAPSSCELIQKSAATLAYLNRFKSQMMSVGEQC
jgi:hypothetical protein